MGRASGYSPEVRERVVRMVLEHQGEYDSEWAAIRPIAEKIGCASGTLLALHVASKKSPAV